MRIERLLIGSYNPDTKTQLVAQGSFYKKTFRLQSPLKKVHKEISKLNLCQSSVDVFGPLSKSNCLYI